ncbi:MAG: hypothetical protein VKM92_03370 [Cyanobacteriota bacterium]|nr:hypothetical protein [Cyanobacteriota bacterium]
MQFRHGHKTPVTWLSTLARSFVSGLFVLLLVLGLGSQPVAAAEVLQVRNASLLQVGDQNRSYSVELACLEISPDPQSAATDWLRRELPRRTRVNLRPRGIDRGTLVAQVQRLDRNTDVASDLVAAGYGSLLPDCGP